MDDNPEPKQDSWGSLTTVASIMKRKKKRTTLNKRVFRRARNLKLMSGFGMTKWRTRAAPSRKIPETVRATITPEFIQYKRCP